MFGQSFGTWLFDLQDFIVASIGDGEMVECLAWHDPKYRFVPEPWLQSRSSPFDPNLSLRMFQYRLAHVLCNVH